MSIERTSQDTVADRARHLWEQAGRPTGRDLEFWLQAEAQLHQADDPSKAVITVAHTSPPPEPRAPLQSKRSRQTRRR